MGKPEKKLDKFSKEARDWVEDSSNEKSSGDFIVQVELPKRTVKVKRAKGRPVFFGLTDEADGDREVRLKEILEQVIELKLADSKVKILHTAGAIVVSATPEELKKIAALAGVKTIAANRKFSGRPRD
ncbi:MAG: hypothetical protein AB8B55_10775 [Mariniblastus sp.]